MLRQLSWWLLMRVVYVNTQQPDSGDRDLFRGLFLLLGSELRHSYGQHPVFVIRLDGIGARIFRHTEAAHEASVSGLDAMHLLLFMILLVTPLAGQRQDAILELKFDIFLFDAGQLSFEQVSLRRLTDVDRWNPIERRHRLPRARSCAPEH